MNKRKLKNIRRISSNRPLHAHFVGANCDGKSKFTTENGSVCAFCIWNWRWCHDLNFECQFGDCCPMVFFFIYLCHRSEAYFQFTREICSNIAMYHIVEKFTIFQTIYSFILRSNWLKVFTIIRFLMNFWYFFFRMWYILVYTHFQAMALTYIYIYCFCIPLECMRLLHMKLVRCVRVYVQYFSVVSVVCARWCCVHYTYFAIYICRSLK